MYNILSNKKETAVQFQFAVADAKWHRGKTPSPGGNLPSARYLTRHFYSCNGRVRMLCLLNWQAHIFLPLIRAPSCLLYCLHLKNAIENHPFLTEFQKNCALHTETQPGEPGCVSSRDKRREKREEKWMKCLWKKKPLALREVLREAAFFMVSEYWIFARRW